MQLFEYEARTLLKKYEIPIPKGRLCQVVDDSLACLGEMSYPLVLKAQVPVGGRGHNGGVLIVRNEEEHRLNFEKIRNLVIKGYAVDSILTASCADIYKEFYVSIVLDRNLGEAVLVFSPNGGVDIEDLAQNRHDLIRKYSLDSLGLYTEKEEMVTWLAENLCPKDILETVADLLLKMIKLFYEEDALLVEINPLGFLKDGQLVALDGKIVLDDNALFRNNFAKETQENHKSKDELVAKTMGLSFIRMHGSIGCIVNGAGLAMTTLDLIKRAGGAPANFLDCGGSSSPEKIKYSLDLITKDPSVKVILINIFGGITRCDDIAKGLVDAWLPENEIPLVVRIEGNRAKEAREILTPLKCTMVHSLWDGAKVATEIANKP